MQYTAFLVVFPDPYVQGKLFKNKGKTCPFLVHCCQFKCSLSATNKTLWVAFKRFNMANPIISFCNQPIRLELARSRKSFPVFQGPVLKRLHSVFVCISSHTGASNTSLSCESVRESLPLKDSFSTGQHLCYSNDCFPRVLSVPACKTALSLQANTAAVSALRARI